MKISLPKWLLLAVAVVCTPITCALIFLVGWEAYLTSKMDKLGTNFKFNNQRVIELTEMHPGSSVLEKTYYDIEHPDKLVNVETDDLGFLVPSTGHKNPDITLAFMGNSITYGEHISPKDRFPYLTGQLLEEKLNKKVNSLNSATAGQNMFQSINVLVNKVLPQNPDFIIILPGQNDITLLRNSKGYWNQNNRQNVVNKYSFGLVVKYFKNMYFPNTYMAITNLMGELLKQWTGYKNKPDHKHGNMWSYLRNLWPSEKLAPSRQPEQMAELLKQRTNYKNQPEPSKKLAPSRQPEQCDQPTPKETILPFKSALLSWIKIAESWGSIPIIIFKPVIEEPYKSFKGSEVYAQTIRDAAKETGTLLIDLVGKIQICRCHSNAECADQDIADRMHFSKKGSRKVANILADALEIEINIKKKR